LFDRGKVSNAHHEQSVVKETDLYQIDNLKNISTYEKINREIEDKIHNEIPLDNSDVDNTTKSVNHPNITKPDMRRIKKKKRSKGNRIKEKDKLSKQVVSPSHETTSNNKWRSREQRAESRKQAKFGESYFADWLTHEENDIYFSFEDLSYYCIDNVITPEEYEELYSATDVQIEEGYKVLKGAVPSSYAKALADPEWGEAAREELQTIFEAKTLVRVSKVIAQEDIDNRRADFVIMFPIYEEKIKEGKIVKKVRLVCNGKNQKLVGNVYASTPSREELLILLHIYAALDWDFVHIDEKRAFLKAEKLGEKCYTKIPGEREYYEIVGALYGLRTSPKDYQITVINRLRELNFEQLQMCSCIFIRREKRGVVIVYNFVDDQIIGSNNEELLQEYIVQYRAIVDTTEPIWNPTTFLGIEVTRDREKRIIKIKVNEKIEQLGMDNSIEKIRVKNIPLTSDGFVIDESLYEEEKYKSNSQFLEIAEIREYMRLVGSFIWICGIRKDITFAVLYLSWYTQNPRKHHLNMAKALLSYLYHSRDLPLILGGEDVIHPITFTDSSMGTAPKGRSISGESTKLNRQSGAVNVTSSATIGVRLSSFEGELEAFTKGLKSSNRISNILRELDMEYSKPIIYSDNMAMIEFIKGNAVAKGIRHIELKLYYAREQFKIGKADVQYMEGKTIPSDKLTKTFSKTEFHEFRTDILGLKLDKIESNETEEY
jgi:hypothetical protein